MLVQPLLPRCTPAGLSRQAEGQRPQRHRRGARGGGAGGRGERRAQGARSARAAGPGSAAPPFSCLGDGIRPSLQQRKLTRPALQTQGCAVFELARDHTPLGGDRVGQDLGLPGAWGGPCLPLCLLDSRLCFCDPSDSSCTRANLGAHGRTSGPTCSQGRRPPSLSSLPCS